MRALHLVGFAAVIVALTGLPAYVQAQNKLSPQQFESLVRQAPPEIQKQVAADQARVKADFENMNLYHDLLVQRRASEQDIVACLNAETDARQYVQEIVNAYTRNPKDASNALRIQVAADVEDEMNATNACPGQPLFDQVGNNAFSARYRQ